MLMLYESAAGFGLFKLNKTALLDDPEMIAKHFESPEDARKAVSLEAFAKFKDTKAAMDASTDLIEGKLGKSLKKFLKKNMVDREVQAQIAVYDKTLGAAIQKKLGLDVVYSPSSTELLRGIRSQVGSLLEGLEPKESDQMALGLAHTLSRFKLKFSPDKVDTMIVQAIGLLDDVDKELNNFVMRLREWYGWHFPELTKVVTDNMVYAQVVKAVGMRTNVKNVDFDGIVPEELADEIKKCAEVSFGTEVTKDDLDSILELCDRVIDLANNRAALAEYLKNRMHALAPNLTVMVGELVGARLISHAGSLMNLAKHPASTVQILGAEKALFRALKQKKQTPKYGLIYHASLVGQSNPKHKGKVSRCLAAKLSLCARVDALGDGDDTTLGEECKEYVEKRMHAYESGNNALLSKSKAGKKTEKYVAPKADKETTEHNADADVVDDVDMSIVKKDKKEKKEKKEKKRKAEAIEEAAEVGADAEAEAKAAKKARKAAKKAKKEAE